MHAAVFIINQTSYMGWNGAYTNILGCNSAHSGSMHAAVFIITQTSYLGWNGAPCKHSGLQQRPFLATWAETAPSLWKTVCWVGAMSYTGLQVKARGSQETWAETVPIQCWMARTGTIIQMHTSCVACAYQRGKALWLKLSSLPGPPKCHHVVALQTQI